MRAEPRALASGLQFVMHLSPLANARGSAVSVEKPSRNFVGAFLICYIEENSPAALVYRDEI
jgi:hypothetical protein